MTETLARLDMQTSSGGGQDRGFVPKPAFSSVHPPVTQSKNEGSAEGEVSPVLWSFAKTRLRKEEYWAFLCVLLKLDTTCSRFLRKVIREVIGWGPEPLEREMKDFREAVNQVAALGRNINQMLRAYHAGQASGLLIDQAALEGFRNQVEELRKELARVIQRSREKWLKL